uniref:Uncharacterized protein n=1 Tax=Meloidogyne floridensis TaxID=298350 RepID=A0A915NUU7_9BILA
MANKHQQEKSFFDDLETTNNDSKFFLNTRPLFSPAGKIENIFNGKDDDKENFLNLSYGVQSCESFSNTFFDCANVAAIHCGRKTVMSKDFELEFVLENALNQPPPPPSLVNDYLNYLLNEGQISQFEQSVIRLPVESMDLHQICNEVLA